MDLSNDISVLNDLIVRSLNRIELLESENSALGAENAELRWRLNKNSGNSHKPPSSEGLKKKPALPQSKGQKSGGQLGHSGKTLEMVPCPDHVVVHHAPSCSCCFKEFAATEVEQTAQRREGSLHWFHVASTALFTYLFVHKHRGEKALRSAASLLQDFKNWAVHDCWKTCFGFEGCAHALCNAHILRELQALTENGSLWAAEMKALLLEMFQLSQKATQLLPDKDDWLLKYKLLCQKADKEEPSPVQGKRGKPKNSKGRNLLNRLVLNQGGILAFAFEQPVPFTNNQAERDIRCLKTKQKVATSFRTFKGAQHHARIQSFVSTLRKHRMSVFQNLVLVFEGKPISFKAA